MSVVVPGKEGDGEGFQDVRKAYEMDKALVGSQRARDIKAMIAN